MQSEQINELVAALVAAQMEFPVIEKTEQADIPTKGGGSYSYKYADIAAIAAKINPILNKNGLAISQEPSIHESGQPSLTTTLLHVSGQWRSSEMLLQIAIDAGAQSQGSAITYARRYAKSAVLDLVTDSDDDGAAATHSSGKSSDGLREPSGPRAADIAVILKGAALAPDNQILSEMAGKWHQWGKLSDKQIKWALDLAAPYVDLAADNDSGPITVTDTERQNEVIRSIQSLTDAQKEELREMWSEQQLPPIKSGLRSSQLDEAEKLVRFISNPVSAPREYDYAPEDERFA